MYNRCTVQQWVGIRKEGEMEREVRQVEFGAQADCLSDSLVFWCVADGSVQLASYL